MNHQPGEPTLGRSTCVRTIASVCSALLVLASCGDDTTSEPVSSQVPATESASTAAPPASDAASPETDQPSDSGDDAGEGIGTEFCDIGQTLETQDLNLSGTPAEVQAAMESFIPLFEQSIDLAPDRFRPYVTRLAEFYDGFYDVLEVNGFNATDAFSDPEFDLAERFDEIELESAGIDAALTSYCGYES